MKKNILPILYAVALLAGCKHDKVVVILPSFEKTMAMSGNQEAHRLISVADGLFIIGTSTVGTEKKLLLIHTDLNGNIVWQKQLDAGTEGFSVKHTADDQLVVMGSVTDGNNKDLYLAKTDLHGNIIWQKNFGGSMSDIGRDVIELAEGGFMLIGTTQSFGAGPASMFVVRTDAEGNELWSRTFGGDGLDGGSELTQMSANEVMLLGFAGSFGAGDRDLYLQSVSMEGDSLWSSTYGGAGYEESQSFQPLWNGGYVMSNHSASNEPNHSLLATKLDANGQVVWELEFGTPQAHEGGEGVLAASDGNYVFLGRTNSFGNGEQVYFIRTDASGNVLDELNFGAAGDQSGADIIQVGDAYFIVGTSTVNGDSDVLLIKRPM